MDQTIDIEKIMEEIRAEAAGNPALAEDAPFEDENKNLRWGGGLVLLRKIGRRVKGDLHRVFGKIARGFAALHLYMKNQVSVQKNLLTENSRRIDQEETFTHGELYERLRAVETENAALKARLDALQGKAGE